MIVFSTIGKKNFKSLTYSCFIYIIVRDDMKTMHVYESFKKISMHKVVGI